MTSRDMATQVAFGKISFAKEIPPQPERREQKGNTTNITPAQPGSPPRYDVKFHINHASGPDQPDHFVVWSVRLPMADNDARHRPYSEIEREGFAVLVDQIQALASNLAEQLEENTTALGTHESDDEGSATPQGK